MTHKGFARYRLKLNILTDPIGGGSDHLQENSIHYYLFGIDLTNFE